MKLEIGGLKRIGIFRALQIGDMLCAIPAIRALRQAYPQAEITLIGLPWASALVERFPAYFNAFICFPGYPGLPEQEFVPSSFIPFLQEVQARQFDLVLQMQGDGSIVNPMVELFGAKTLVGFCKQGHYTPQNGLFLPYPNSGHEIDRHLALMNFIGVPSSGRHLEFPLVQKDFDDLSSSGLNLKPGEYVCIHPGARGTSRQWPPANYARLADAAAEHGFEVVLTGTAAEMEIIGKVAAAMKYTPIIAAGKTSLGAVAVLIKNSYALVSNCTGVSHIASALRVRSLVVSLDVEPSRWQPVDSSLHKTMVWYANPDLNWVLDEMMLLLRQGTAELS